MLTKQQIADRIKALDTDVHADATRAFTSAQRHTTIQQMPERRELMAACNEAGGHVFAVSGRCKFCKASDDRPNVANLGVATGVAAGLSDGPSSAARWVVSADPSTAPVEWVGLSEKTSRRYAISDALRRLYESDQPAPEVISKAPDALPAANGCDDTDTIAAWLRLTGRAY